MKVYERFVNVIDRVKTTFSLDKFDLLYMKS